MQVYDYEISWRWKDLPNDLPKLDYVEATSEDRAKENLIHLLLDVRDDARDHLEVLDTLQLSKVEETD